MRILLEHPKFDINRWNRSNRKLSYIASLRLLSVGQEPSFCTAAMNLLLDSPRLDLNGGNEHDDFDAGTNVVTSYLFDTTRGYKTNGSKVLGDMELSVLLRIFNATKDVNFGDGKFLNGIIQFSRDSLAARFDVYQEEGEHLSHLHSEVVLKKRIRLKPKILSFLETILYSESPTVDVNLGSPLHTALECDSIEAFRLLLGHPRIDISQTDRRGNNLLHRYEILQCIQYIFVLII